MTISLEEAYQFLENCSAIIIDDNVVTYPCLSDLDNDPDNEWLLITWDNERGEEFSAKFSEENNKEITIVNSSMFLTDTEGDEFHLSVLTTQNMEKEINTSLNIVK